MQSYFCESSRRQKKGHELVDGFVFIHQTWIKKPAKFDSGSNVWSLPAEVTHQALPTAMVMSEAFGGLHPAGCNLDSHEVF